MTLVKKGKLPPRSLHDYFLKRNQILVWQKAGGIGDVLMQRMLFEDIHRIMPEAEIHFACPPQHHEVAAYHPHLSQILDSKTVNPDEYLCVYDTCVIVADRYERRMAPYCQDHRADIWAAKLGITLQNHEMHLNLPIEVIQAGAEQLKPLRSPGKPLVALCPTSRKQTKSLLPHQIQGLVEAYPGYQFVAFHQKEVGIPTITDLSLTEWMGCLAACDYVVSVDTAAFHVAGGLKKPLVGIFTWADGKVYGKYFDFVLVQKHRDNGNWSCGPCFEYHECPKTKEHLKPCLTELSLDEIKVGVDQMFKKWPWNTQLV